MTAERIAAGGYSVPLTHELSGDISSCMQLWKHLGYSLGRWSRGQCSSWRHGGWCVIERDHGNRPHVNAVGRWWVEPEPIDFDDQDGSY